METRQNSIDWIWKPFSEISGLECWSMLELRQNVFLIEQNCQYSDVDRDDLHSWHLFGWERAAKSSHHDVLTAYQRLVPPSENNAYPSLGRIVIHPDYRGLGLGKQLVQSGITKIGELFPENPIRISAQKHLTEFYASFGFQVDSEPYLDAGIPHVKMLLPKSNKNH